MGVSLRVGEDLDGCAHSFTEQTRKLVAEVLGRDIETLTIDKWNYFEDWGLTSDEFWEIVWQGHAEGKVWAPSDVPEPGFIECNNRLRKAGHTIHICTSRRKAELSTFQWIIEQKIPHDSITISSDKTIVDVDVFVDDNEDNLLAIRDRSLTTPVVFDQPWNRMASLDDFERVRSWEEFADFVEKLAAEVEH